MHIREKVCACVVVFFIIFAAVSERAQAQLLSSLEPVMHFQTEAFDIYAPATMEAQAQSLAGFADKTYTMLREFFGVEAATVRIPVLLSDSQHSLNGYFTLYPSNRIVLLLASADPRSQLASMQDELYSVFLHELVHYVTLNERTPVWKALAWLGGDYVAPELWMMPEAMVEGTAVWVESRLTEDGSGRLNDSAALEAVRLERARGKARSLWDVSGLSDFYGSGSLPYLYGGLFLDYISERYGPDMIGRLWRASSGGNIFRGFDGTLTSRGILERETGIPPRILWNEFLHWVDEESDKSESSKEETRDEHTAELVSGYIGAAAAGERALYYVDIEKRGVYALSLEDVGRSGDSEEGGSRKGGAVRLFAADGMLRNIFFNVKFRGLDFDWIRVDAQNRQIPARYRYDIEKRHLSYEYDLPMAGAGEATANLQGKPGKDIFLYDAWQDDKTGLRYGLVRIGTTVLPARQFQDGHTEVPDIPDYCVRWLSPGFRSASDSDDSIRFVLSVIPDNGLSRLAVLEEQGEDWRFAFAEKTVLGGVHQPFFVSKDGIAYHTSKGEGQTAICLLDLSSFQWTSQPIRWISSSDWIEHHAPEARSTEPQTPAPDAKYLQRRTVLFPSLFSTTRVFYANTSLVGLNMVASDLTDRLLWSVFSGWNFSTGRPLLDTQVQLEAGAWQCGLSASDQGVLFSTIARNTAFGATLEWNHTLLPNFRSVSAEARAVFSGIQNNYSIHDFFDIVPDYYAWATGLDVSFSSTYSSPRPPFDSLGFSISGTTEYEAASLAGFGGVSLSGSMNLKGRLGATLYGAIAPMGGVAFAPATRYLESRNSYMLSAVGIPYPEYWEYRNFLNPSPWYVFGEAQFHLFSIESGGVLRLPFLPSFALRRIVGKVGLRGAGLDIGGDPGILSSAFVLADFDFAPLAGLSAETHSHFTLEASWAFQASETGVEALSISGGFQTTL